MGILANPGPHAAHYTDSQRKIQDVCNIQITFININYINIL